MFILKQFFVGHAILSFIKDERTILYANVMGVHA